MRAFIALEISREVRQEIRGIIERLQKGIQFGGASPKWAAPDGIHLTLRFLGEIEEEMVGRLRGLLKEAAAESKPFHLSIGSLGFFPNERNPRVLWIGVGEGAEESEALQKKIERGVVALGFSAEDRPFHPHLTLARIKSARGARGLVDVVASHRDVSAGLCVVDRIMLFQSELKPTGAVYTKLVDECFGMP
jgi:2'-5' RNA ligase